MSDSDVFTQYITGLSLGPLTTTFTPGGPGCATIILQVGDEEPGNGQTAQWASLKYRPIDLTSCYPDAWTWHFPHSTYFHSPGVCPSGMTYACMGTTTPGPEEQVVSTAFCCPSGYTCSQEGSAYCYSTFPTPSALSANAFLMNYTYLYSSEAGATTSREFYAATVLGAYWPTIVSVGPTKSAFYDSQSSLSRTSVFARVVASAVVVQRSEGDPEWEVQGDLSSSSRASSSVAGAATSSSSSKDDDDHSGALSTGAIAGVAVGATIGGLLLLGSVVAAVLIARRKRRRMAQEAEEATANQASPRPPDYDAQEGKADNKSSSPQQAVELSGGAGPWGRGMLELTGREIVVGEVAAARSPVEMQG